ncbi:MAG TPA: DUF2934 domain-containing protein [Arenibaculum sp.]|nr:DUF2934 domain-containing protein [Arenibaculum sp.]
MREFSEDRIRRRAYEIWEREGRPDGRHELHWTLAIEDLARDAAVRVEIETVDAVDPHTRLAEVHILPPAREAGQEDEP